MREEEEGASQTPRTGASGGGRGELAREAIVWGGVWFTEQTGEPGEPVRGGVRDRSRDQKGRLGGVRTDGG